MDAEFWQQAWQRREIGFHKDQVHHLLREEFPRLQLAAGARVLVPLCGKSLDLLWLRDQGYAVVGVELSPLAVSEFFAENGLPYEKSSAGPLTRYQSDRLEILCGDFFALERAHIGPVAAAYDRAGLVALPPAMRRAYAGHLRRLLGPGGQLLLISFDYPQEQMEGPPFAVPEGELAALFAGDCRLCKLRSEAALEQFKKLQEAGVSWLQEEVYQIVCAAAAA